MNLFLASKSNQLSIGYHFQINVGPEKCGSLDKFGNWKDSYCTTEYGFICEKNTPEPGKECKFYNE